MHLLASTSAAFLYACFILPLFLNTFSLAQLSTSFYASSCPQAVSTISNTFASLAKQDNVVAPSTLRLILHDCFVEGCDGSILISSTPGNVAEKDAPDNQNLPPNAFNAINQLKSAVEQLCPGVVSCADIVALAARDSVVFLGGPSYDVPLGRLDGLVSTAASVTGNLPGANFDVQQLASTFASVGLSLEDMVVLSGAHTIGFSQCDQFRNRLYSFSSTSKVDPSMDPTFAQQLQQQCPANGGDPFVPLDFATPFTFDNKYYQDLQAGKGLLFSDQVLFQDASTKPLVQTMAGSQDQFFSLFTSAMIKLCSTGAKQGAQGEVRKDCSKVNAGGGATAPATPSPPSPSPPSPVLRTPPNIAASPPQAPVVTPSPKPLQNVSPPPSFEASPPPPLTAAPATPPPTIVASPPPPLTSSPPATPPPTIVASPPPTLTSSPPATPPPTIVVSTPASPPPIIVASPPPPLTSSTPATPATIVASAPPLPPAPLHQIPPPSPPDPPAQDPPPPPLDEAAPPPQRSGFTIPGIAGVIPPIHVTLPRVFRRRPPSPSDRRSGSSSAADLTEHV